MANALQLELLRQIFSHWVKFDVPMSINQVTIPISTEQIKEELNLMLISNLIEESEGGYLVTQAGRSKFKVVLTGGAYDLLHRGHIITLNEAKNLGDVLVVVIARNTTVKRRKRDPIHSEEDRMFLLNELRCVDAAVLGDQVDYMRVVRRVKPDFIALGADQDHIKEVLEAQIKDQGLTNTKIVRLQVDYEGLATTKVIDEILSREW